jgi:group I intron endonuclease
MSEAKTGENHPMFGQNHSDETRQKISDALTGESNPNYGKPRSDEIRGKISLSMPNSSKIEVFDLQENTTTYYNSMSEAARALNISSHKIISQYIKINQTTLYKGRYTFKKF